METKLSGTPQQMADQCSSTAGCVGFTSDGRMKSAIAENLEAWASEQPCDGIYVAIARTGTGAARLAGRLARMAWRAASAAGGTYRACPAHGQWR